MPNDLLNDFTESTEGSRNSCRDYFIGRSLPYDGSMLNENGKKKTVSTALDSRSPSSKYSSASPIWGEGVKQKGIGSNPRRTPEIWMTEQTLE